MMVLPLQTMMQLSDLRVMEKIWFIYADEIVSGPFTTEKVQSDLEASRWDTNSAQIWWKGQKEWLSLTKWSENLHAILDSNKTQTQQPVWYAEQHGEQVGPLTKEQLVTHLSGVQNVKSVRLWTVGLNHWTNLFEFHEILAQLGISKRSFDRAPIVGHVSIQKNGEVFNKTIASVSGGGLGVKDCHELMNGEVLAIAIHSPLLVAPVRATAKVMYIEENGYVGLQFQTIHIESKTTLMDYVKQFRSDPTTRDLSEHTQFRKTS